MKNRILSMLSSFFVFCAAFAARPLPGSAAFNGVGVTESGISYNIFDDHISVTDYHGGDPVMVIPEEIDGLPVKSISGQLMKYSYDIVAVDVPNSVESIGQNALPKTVLLIADPGGYTEKFAKENGYFFAPRGSEMSAGGVIEDGGCDAEWVYDFLNRSLTVTGSGRLPDYMNKPSPWSGFSAVAEALSISGGITYIGSSDFESFSRLKTLELPSGLEDISFYAFRYCSALSKVEFPPTLTRICASAFLDCSSLEEADFPDGLSDIGEKAFSGCEKLKNVVLPKGLTVMGQQAFYNCAALESAVFSDGLTVLNSEMFRGCESLREVKLPGTLQGMSKNIFWGCHALESVNLPEGVTRLNEGFFAYCRSLTHIDIPQSITNIEAKAFIGCEALSEIELPDAVTAVGESAFEDCKSLKRIALGQNITEIASTAFNGVPKDAVMAVYENSFADIYALSCGFRVEYLGKSETEVEVAELEYNLVDGEYYEVVGLTNPFEARKAVVPAAYQGLPVKGIGRGGLTRAGFIVYAELPEGLEYIGDGAFENCILLNNIYIPSTVKTLGKEAFRGCKSLSLVNFGREELNDIYTYLDNFNISVFKNTPFCENLFELPGYNEYSRDIMGARPELDAALISDYVDQILEETGASGPNEDSVRKVYDWICKNVHYTVGDVRDTGAYGALFMGGASCAGYAEVFGLCMRRLGIEYSYVEGKCTGRYGVLAHRWNMVNLGNGWYHVDATDTRYGDYSTYMKDGDYFRNAGYSWSGAKFPKSMNPTAGTLSDDLSWRLAGGELIFEGGGAVPSYKEACAPWYNRADEIKSVYIGAGVTSVGANALFGMDGAEVKYDGGADEWERVGKGKGNSALDGAAAAISLNKTALDLEIGNNADLEAVIASDKIKGAPLVWTSSDVGVASVNGGTVTAVSAGTAVITVSAGEGYSASCAVSVTARTGEAAYSVTEIDAAPDGGGLLIKVTFTKNDDSAGEDTLIVAAYEDGALVDMAAVRRAFPKGTLVESVRLRAGEGAVVRAFVWDGLSGLKPLGNVFEK